MNTLGLVSLISPDKLVEEMDEKEKQARVELGPTEEEQLALDAEAAAEEERNA